MNILLITTDEHRWDFIGSRHHDFVNTPNIDRLMREGIYFTNGYSNCPICMPTRFTWLYGLYASQVAQRLLVNAHDWPVEYPSFAQILQKNGYYTAMIGKLHSLSGIYRRDVVAYKYETIKRGFDHVCEVSGGVLAAVFDCEYTRYLEQKGLLNKYRTWVQSYCKENWPKKEEVDAPFFLEPEDHLDGFVAQRACEFISSYQETKPFFAHVSFCGPHFPMVPAQKYYDKYKAEDMPAPIGVNNPEEIALSKRNRALYAAFVEQTDAQIGRVLDALDAAALTNDTLVIFTTDHGELLGDYGLYYKSKPQDLASRTPVIMRLPGRIPAGRESSALLEAVDLPATILEAAGVDGELDDLMPQTPGISYWKNAFYPDRPHRDWVYSECGLLPNGWRMARDEEFKYVFWPNKGHQLYNLAEDPYETRNLIDDCKYQDRVMDMQQMLLSSVMTCVAPNSDNDLGRGIHKFDHPNHV